MSCGYWKRIPGIPKRRGRVSPPSPLGPVKRKDGLAAHDLGAVTGAGGQIETVARFQVVGYAAGGDPQDSFDHGVTLLLRVLVLGKDSALTIGVDGDFVALALENTHHPFLGRWTVGPFPTFETDLGHAASRVAGRKGRRGEPPHPYPLPPGEGESLPSPPARGGESQGEGGNPLLARVRAEDIVERLRRVDIEIEVIDTVGSAERERGDAGKCLPVDRDPEARVQADVDRDDVAFDLPGRGLLAAILEDLAVCRGRGLAARGARKEARRLPPDALHVHIEDPIDILRP